MQAQHDLDTIFTYDPEGQFRMEKHHMFVNS